MKKNTSSPVLRSKTPKVYKNKKLNTANFGDFSRSDYNIFLHLVSKIGGVDEQGNYLQPDKLKREHILTAKEFSEVFNTNIDNSYRMLHNSCKKLMKTSIIIEKIELNETWEVNVCSTAKYNKKEGRITIEFTDRIMPYLAQARQRFMLYNLKEIANFGSLYTTRLYELIQEFQETGWLLKSVNQLREIFAVGDKFKTYNNFKRKTFGHACEEINSNYVIGLRFEEIKNGQKVVAIKFFFKKTKIHRVINQHTGVLRNLYEKPELLKKEKKNKVKKQDSGDTRLSFENLKEGSKSIKDVMSSLLIKFFSTKK